MFERWQGGERAILVQLALPGVDSEKALAEFEELALSADAEILEVVRGARATPEAKYYLGKGKAEEIRDLANALNAEIILVNHELSPSQGRNLEKLIECKSQVLPA